MKNCKKLALLLILLLLIATMSTVFVACNKEKPYYGTYYMEKDKNPMTIDEDYVTLFNNKYQYEYAGGVITLSSGSRIKFAEDYQVAYFPEVNDSNLNGKIRVRNGNIAVQFSYDGTYYNFNLDGTFRMVDTASYIITNGTYTLKDGVLLITNTYSIGTNGHKDLGNSYFWYIDNDYKIYVLTFVKDYTKFQTTVDDTPNNPGGTTDSGNIGDNDNNDSSQDFIVPIDDCTIGQTFSKKQIYDVTEQCYMIHEALDFNAPVGSTVKSIGDGEVNGIKNDEHYGTTVSIAHKNGFTSIYRLICDTPLRVGEKVNKGDTVGKVSGNVKSESALGPHLHLELFEYGTRVNPILYISSFKNNLYTVTWINYDGTVLDTDYNVPGGSTPYYYGSTPTRDADENYIYTFDGWSPSVSSIYRDTTYTAQFTSSLKVNSYTVTWKNYDGTVLETDYNVPRGSTPTYDGNTPTRAADDDYEYTFKGWSPSITSIYGDTTYTAQFTSSLKEKYYTVTWKNYDGTVLEIDYNVLRGSTPTYDGNAPTREAEEDYVYTFKGWSPTVSSIYEDTTYTAQFSSILSYTVTWKNYDGTVLETDYNVPRGSTPTYDGSTPTREAEEGYNYIFKGWSPSVSSVYEDKTFTAQYAATLAIPNLPTNTQPLLESANTSFEGDGTEESPYLIKTSAQLLGMGAYADKHFALANNIILPLNSEDRPNFSPLFSDEKPFNGTFDGRGYTIKNLYIYNTDTYYTGLFASVGENGVVKNLELADVKIFGANYVGGIAGLSFGSIIDCEVSGNITYVPANDYQVYIGGIAGRGSLDKCNSAVEIKVFGFNSTCYVGGLAGYSTSKSIPDSSNTGNIIVKTTIRNSNNSTYVGGLVGYGYSSNTITSSYNTGAITVDSGGVYTYVGGLVGSGYSITSSYNTGAITVDRGSYTRVGGLMGAGSSITSSYNTGSITVDSGGSTYVGGLMGSGSSITSSYNTGSITVDSGGSTYVGGLMGSDSSSATITSSYNTGAITVNSGSDSSTYVGGLAGYGSVTIKNSHWLYYEDGAPVNAVGYNSGMGVPTNIGATKHMSISEFYNLADTLNEGLTTPAFEHKTSSSLPTLIKKEN